MTTDCTNLRIIKPASTRAQQLREALYENEMIFQQVQRLTSLAQSTQCSEHTFDSCACSGVLRSYYRSSTTQSGYFTGDSCLMLDFTSSNRDKGWPWSCCYRRNFYNHRRCKTLEAAPFNKV